MVTTIHKVGFVFVPFVPRGEGEGDDEKVVFDEKQQAKVNDLIKEAMGRAGKELRTELDSAKNLIGDLQSKLTEAENRAKNAKTPAAKEGAEDDVAAIQAQLNEAKSVASNMKKEHDRLLQQLQAKDQEIVKAKDEVKTIRKHNAMRDAAGKVDFFDVSMVLKITEDSVQWSEERGKFVVVSPESGTERLNNSLEPMTLDEFYSEFAQKNPFAVRSGMKAGAGSSETQRAGLSKNGKFTVDMIFGKDSDPQLANELAKRDIQEYHRLKAIAKSQGLIA